MSDPVVELLLWVLLAFFVGCILGCLLKMAFGPRPVASTPASDQVTPVAPLRHSEPMKASPPRAASKPAQSAQRKQPAASVEAANPAKPEKVLQPTSPPEAASEPVQATPAEAGPEGPPLAQTAEPARLEEPKGIPAPRGGQPDNLKRISGIGPKIERTLHTLGFFHFDQLAGWTEDQVRWVENHLKFKGRIAREKWLEQARLLAEGREEEFATVFGGSETAKKPMRKSPPPPKSGAPDGPA